VTADLSPDLAPLEAMLRRCEAQGITLSPRCLVVLALLVLHGLPLTARAICALADETPGAAMSPDGVGRVLRRLWRAGLIVRLDRRHGYVARSPRPPELGLFLCEPCTEGADLSDETRVTTARAGAA
jgi:Fe2+ or Zn2+ uptake regulation protein